jgi:hypothetical protein
VKVTVNFGGGSLVMAQNAEPTIDTQANNNITIEKAKILLKLTMLFV